MIQKICLLVFLFLLEVRKIAPSGFLTILSEGSFGGPKFEKSVLLHE